MNNKSFHDYEVLGLFFDDKNNLLTLQMRMPNNEKMALEFLQVKDWEISPFESQNILFNIEEYSSTNLPEWLVNDYNIKRDEINDEATLFLLEPSVGLGGYIIAKEKRIIKAFNFNDILESGSNNYSSILKDKRCGCYYCLEIFSPTQISLWKENVTEKIAICPFCGIDAVIGENCGYPISEELLKEMNYYWL